MKNKFRLFIGLACLGMALVACSSNSSDNNANHVHVGGTPVQENVNSPTCTEEGSCDLVVYCVEDHYEMSREHIILEPLGHDFHEERHPATFEEEGYIIYTCSRCEYSYRETSERVLEHNYSNEWSIDLEKGTHYHACIDIGYESLRSEEANHIYSWEITEAATATEDGSKHGTCTVCGHEKDEIFHATGTPEKLSFVLEQTPEKHYIVFASSSSIEGEVVIPAYYNDLPVTDIHRYGFSSSNITSIIIPASIKTIPDSCFFMCHCLTSITIEENSKLTSIGDNAFYGTYIKSITIPYGIEVINGGTFQGCSDLETVTFVENSQLKTIQGKAFSGCSSLTSITLPNRLNSIEKEAFENCISLETVEIPQSLMRIEEAAFKGCSSLVALENLETAQLVSIGKEAFENCTSLVSINIPSTVGNIGSSTFEGCTSLVSVVIPNKITTINHSLFRNCTSLASIALSSGATSIGDSAFYGCSSLKSIIIPDNVETIDGYAFGNCSSLKSITFGENSKLTTIGSYAFANCKSIRSIEIPKGVTSIGSYAFLGCTLLALVNIPDGVNALNTGTFYNCISLVSVSIGTGLTTVEFDAFTSMPKLFEVINKSSYEVTAGGAVSGLSRYAKHVLTDENDSKIRVDTNGFVTYSDESGVKLIGYVGDDKEISIPNGVDEICYYSFYGCSDITSVSIPNGVTIIEDWAFSGCSSLVSINIPQGVTYIGYNAFSNCSSLRSIAIPNSTTYIGDSAFLHCSSLESISLPFIGITPTKGGYHYLGQIFGASEIEQNAEYVPESLKEVTLIDGCTYLDAVSFDNCQYITSVSISKTVQEIDSGIFLSCPSLTSINVDSNSNYFSSENGVLYNKDKTALIRYPSGKEETSFSIPNGVLSINNCAFEDAANLTTIVVPNSVYSIGMRAFRNCTSLTSINIPYNVTSISGATFQGCSSLETIVIPSSVTSIGESAFYGCSSLQSVNIPQGITSISDSTFFGCTSLETITIPHSVTSVGTYVFGTCSSLEEITYQGTINEWNKITIGAGFKYFNAISVIHCTNGDVEV